MEHFDFQQLKKYLDNDPVVLRGFLTILKKELPASYQELATALANNNFTQLHEANHKLKGTALTASLPTVVDISARLSELTAIDQTTMQPLLEELKKEIDLIIPLIDEKLADLL